MWNLMCASCVFCVENLSARKVRAEQEEPYADILIFPGRDREEVCLSA